MTQTLCSDDRQKYEGLPEEELFEMEYHTFQHAKLGAGGKPPLARQVAIVTGAGQGIGKAIALTFCRAGAQVIAADVNSRSAESTAEQLHTASRPLPSARGNRFCAALIAACTSCSAASMLRVSSNCSVT